MSQYQRLLLIIDPTLRQYPAQHAMALARASGASLHILALVPAIKGLWMLEERDRLQLREDCLRPHRDWLNEQTTPLQGRGITVTTQLTWAEDMEKDIIDYVTDMQPDLLIKQIRHESAFKRAIFTPLDWQLLRHCQVPVYLVGSSRHVLPRKVVAAVEVTDTTPADNTLNERIIQQASSLALQCDAELHLLYACTISAAYLADYDGLTLAELTKALGRDLKKAFLALADQFGVPSDRRHFIEGHPIAVLNEFSHDHQMDVIVMGKVQSHGLGKLLGSTTEHILYQAPCSILAV
jgi:universal stress protein E